MIRFVTKQPFLIGCIVLVSGLGCERRAEAPPPMAVLLEEDEPDQESWDVHLGTSVGGRPRYQIVAPYMAKYEREDSVYTLLLPGKESEEIDSLDVRVTAYLFDEEGDSSATINANRMLYFDEEERFEARGNVIVVTKEKKTPGERAPALVRSRTRSAHTGLRQNYHADRADPGLRARLRRKPR